MLTALLALSAATLLALVALLLRRPPAPAADPRPDDLLHLLTRMEAGTEARLSSLDTQLRATVASLQAELAGLRRDASADAQQHRDTLNQSAVHLRDEVTRILMHLGGTLTTHLADHRDHSASTLGVHRAETSAAAESLRYAVKQDLDAISQRLSHFIDISGRHQTDSRDALHNRLNELGTAQAAHQESLRFVVEQRLDALNTSNAARLEEMRATVDEKLHATLHSRLTESFGQVTDQLTKVHSGLGEMSKLSEGVDGLSPHLHQRQIARRLRRGFSSACSSSRCSRPLSSFATPASSPAPMRSSSSPVRFPGHSGETLLPIDAKFPREDFERLEHAYETGVPAEITAAGRAFEAAIRTEGKRICEKYIEQPVTTPYAIMFLPTEGLYAEVMRREGLQAELQSKCHVTIAGPSTSRPSSPPSRWASTCSPSSRRAMRSGRFSARPAPSSASSKSSWTPWKSRSAPSRTPSHDLGVRTRAINRTLRDVSEIPVAGDNLLQFEGSVPRLAASGEDA